MSKKDITSGAARVPYCGGSKGDKWALPGGRFTEDLAEAKRVASAIGRVLANQGFAARGEPVEA